MSAMHAHIEGEEVAKSTPLAQHTEQQDPALCSGHEPLLREMRSSFKELGDRLDDRFDGLMDRMADIRAGNAETASSVASAWKEINRLRDKVDEVPGETDEKIAEHKGACAIGDITKTEIKFPKAKSRPRLETYDTPNDLRRSVAPAGHVTLPKWVLYAIIIGGVLAILSIAVVVGVMQPNDAAKIVPLLGGSGQ